MRLSGQDSVRGTFIQRHCDIIDQTTEEHYIAAAQPAPRPGALRGARTRRCRKRRCWASSTASRSTDPNTLTLWEAQFGDFANGAQVVIDQFISSGERKWLRMSGLVMLLPHGYEGQGPEHSSARLERYLQLCAEDNLQVVNCSTPANYFHVLRRQMHPRVPQAADRDDAQVAAAAQEGGLQPRRTWPRAPPSTGCMVDGAEAGADVGGITLKPDDKIRRVIALLGQGLLRPARQRAKKRGVDDVYLLRLEQFYPWPMKSLSDELARFKNAELVWCQEEPKNMGGWTFVDPWLELTLARLKIKAKRARYVGRPASASTAAGLMSRHLKELKTFLDRSLRLTAEVRLEPRSRSASPMTDIMTPALGESVTEATVARWAKKAGDAVQQGRGAGRAGDRQGQPGGRRARGRRADRDRRRGRRDGRARRRCWARSPKAPRGAAPAPRRAKPAPPPPRRPPKPSRRRARPAPPKPPAPPRRAAKAARRAGRWRPRSSGSSPRTSSTRPPSPAPARTAGSPRATPWPRWRPAPTTPGRPRRPVAAAGRARSHEREERVRMTRLRQTIARRLKEAQNTAAMLTTFNEVDMSAVMALRNQYKDAFEKRHGVKLGFMSFFVKALRRRAEGGARRSTPRSTART